ncbi:MAG: DNA polymerase IV [Deltaproteobacteria bacterium]|nr:DNA polymerase IV [Deltaproteobacteria bacterium]
MNKDTREKTIIHLDMDAFYPSVEILDNPDLKGKPVIVGGNSKRGVVSSASYEARRYGVHSAQPIAQALKLCHHGIFLPVRMYRYKELSDRIFEIFHRFTPLVEPLSIDEAFLDVTGTKRLLGDPVTVARTIKKTVYDETGLTVSAGVAPSKFIAKIASDLNKPDGLTVVGKDEIQAFLDPLPVSRMWGAGKVTIEKLSRYNIKTFYDLRKFPVEILERSFGKNGLRMHLLAMGIDDRSVEIEHETKSVGHEETFPEDIVDIDLSEKHLLNLAMKTAERMRRICLKGKTVNLKVKYSDFTQVTRSKTLDQCTDDGMLIYAEARKLLQKTETGRRPVRLLGVSMSGLADEETGQLSLFSEDEKKEKSEKLNRAIDSLHDKFGKKSVVPGRLLSD